MSCFTHEFQERGSGHIYWFIWIFNPPNIQDETAYNEFIGNALNAHLSQPINESDPPKLVKTNQIHSPSRK